MRCAFCHQDHPNDAVVCPTTQQRLAELPGEGTVIDGKYKILGLLGSGGMAVVYRAERTKIGRIVALKMLLPEFRASAEIVQRVEREARAAGSLDHANVVEIVDLGSTEEYGPYIAMEMLNGVDLATHVENNSMRLPALEATDIVRQVLSALAVAHDKGVIHRDLKPENIFLTPDEDRVRVKVLDFGISKLAEKPGTSRLTRVGMVMGTPQFMAPEQATGAPNQDHRADIYSTGVVLYALLTGALPYEAENFNVLISDMLNKPPHPVSDRGTLLDPDLAAIVMKAIARDPADRYASAREMQDALVIWMKNAPVENPADRPSFSDSIRMRFPSAVPQTVRASRPTIDEIAPTTAPAPTSASSPVSATDPTVLASDQMPARAEPPVDDGAKKRSGSAAGVVVVVILLAVGGALAGARAFAPHEWNDAVDRVGLTQLRVHETTAERAAVTHARPTHVEHAATLSDPASGHTGTRRNDRVAEPHVSTPSPPANETTGTHADAGHTTAAGTSRRTSGRHPVGRNAHHRRGH